ncbi:MAG: MBL fold metallo-hydrolase [Gammaproteobacteria bacterium]
MTWMTIGAVGIARVLESNGPFMRIYDFFPDANPEALAPHRHWLDHSALDPATDMMIMPIQSYVVRTPRSTILVDSCVGNHKSVGWFPAWDQRSDDTWQRNLAALDLRPEDIDYVLCTHLHVDHSGWNTQLIDGRWVPTFPNARYVLSRRECAHAERMWTEHQDPVWRENVEPLLSAGQAVLVDDDHQLDDCVHLEPTPGHTPGHCAVHITHGNADAIVTGDLIHSPIQCHFPHWNFKFDTDKIQAAATRSAFLERYGDSPTHVLTAHFPLPSTGYIRRQGAAWHFHYGD